MTKYRTQGRNYALTRGRDSKNSELTQDLFDKLDSDDKHQIDMEAGAKKLGCKKIFPDCPNTINGIDCYKCPFFPKEFRADPSIYDVTKKKQDKQAIAKKHYEEVEKKKNENYKIYGSVFFTTMSGNCIGIVAINNGYEDKAYIDVTNGVNKFVDVQLILKHGTPFPFEQAIALTGGK